MSRADMDSAEISRLMALADSPQVTIDEIWVEGDVRSPYGYQGTLAGLLHFLKCMETRLKVESNDNHRV